MRILQDNEISIEKWNNLLSLCPFASPFQTPQYFDLICNIKEFDGKVYALEKSGLIRVLMVVSIMRESGVVGAFSRRGIIFGGPLIDGATHEDLLFFLSAVAKRLKRKVIYLETRNLFNYSLYKNSFLGSDWIYQSYLDVQHDLKGVNKRELLSSFKYNRRREIKQSIINGATYHLSIDKEEIFTVYKILQQLYKDNVKLPLPAFEFFIGFLRTNLLKVFVVKHDEKIIGGSFCPVLPEKGLYTFYYCGLRDYHKQVFPTHLAVLAALEFAVENNIPKVSFMGAGKPDIGYGVRQYKLEFGGELVEYGRFLKVLNPFLYQIGKLGLKVYKIFR